MHIPKELPCRPLEKRRMIIQDPAVERFYNNTHCELGCLHYILSVKLAIHKMLERRTSM